MSIDINKNKKNIVGLLNMTKRITSPQKAKGIENLISYLDTTDFYIAPASTKYHLSIKGGLAQHSLNVYRRLYELFLQDAKEATGVAEIDNELKYSIVICALMHDLCKANFYKESTRNVKNEKTGVWEKVPFYTVEEEFTYGHGEKSVLILIQNGVILSNEEAQAIRYHMGEFESDRGTGKAYEKNKLAVNLHIADLIATYKDEV